MPMLICVFQQLMIAKIDRQRKRNDIVHPSHTRKQSFFNALYWPTPFFLFDLTKCRQTVFFYNRQVNTVAYSDDWSESSGFKFLMMCEKKIKVNKIFKKGMHNQLNWPHIPLYTFVLCETILYVHNRIAIIIGSVVFLWTFMLCGLCVLSIIMLCCWSRLQ